MKKRVIRHIITTVLLICLVLGCKAQVQAAAKTLALSVVYHKNGFRPSTGNYAQIKVDVAVDKGTTASLRIRVLNTAGKYLFQKNYKSITKNTYYNIKWDGKGQAGNTAGLRTGQCPGTGNYRVEAVTTYVSSGKKVTSKKIVYLPIRYDVASGISGRSNLTYVQMLTGDKNIDYLAEVMCNAAGVKSTMSQEEKVKKIYHWITLNFKHVHYSYSTSYKMYYKLSSLASKVSSYRQTVNSKLTKGTAVFNYYSPYRISWHMERRLGQCNTHAAVFKILCNHMGIESSICKGYYLNRNGTRVGHYWNSAVVNGKTYYYDVDVELQNLGKGQGDYYWYKKTRTEAEKTHLFQ